MTIKDSSVTMRIVDAARRRLGFKNRYDLALWCFLGGTLALFSLRHVSYIHPPTFAKHALPGETYWMGRQPYKFGMMLHLGTIIPASILCVAQFVPMIRTKNMSLHRRIGYTVLFLLVPSTAGTLIIMPHTAGGDPSTIAALCTLASMTCTAAFLGWWNARKLQIDQHRAWMLRAMGWMSQIITLRIILGISLPIVSAIPGHFSIWTCDEALALVRDTSVLHAEFPQCSTLGPNTIIGVPMRIDSLLHAGSALRGMFATSAWLALSLHVLAVEVYLTLTSAESERLRIVSYHRQRAAGMPYPGSMGTIWGDKRSWTPPTKGE